MAKLSLQSQLAALDQAIFILRRYQLPPRSQADFLADQLAPQRDHLAQTLADYNHAAENRFRTRQRDRLREGLDK